MAVAAGVCLVLAALSLLLPWWPSYDPFAWLVFGRELVDPGLGFSTIAHTGWKPLPVLFTAPFGLFGAAAPRLWLLVVRASGLAALALAYRLGARSRGPAAGGVAALALLLSADWLRYLSAGNVEAMAIASLLGAVELHLQRRRGWAFLLGTLTGLARPEIWPLLGVYGLYLWRVEGRRWPLFVALPAMVALWVLPDWAGSGQLFHTFHSATISGEPKQIRDTAHPALELSGRALGILVAPVWIGALVGAVYGWRTRDRAALAVTVAALAWFVVTIGGEAIGYPAVPRYLVEPAALCCVLAGIGIVWCARLPAAAAPRLALIGLLVAACVPFVVARADGLQRQASAATARGRATTGLWRVVDRARAVKPVAGRVPLVAPGVQSTALAWKLRVKLTGVAQTGGRRTTIAFAQGDQPTLAPLRRAGATFTPFASAGSWSALEVHWPAPSPA